MKIQSRHVPLGSLVYPQKAKAFGEKDPARPYVGLEHLAQGQPVFLGSSPSSDSISVNSVFEVDDILFGKLRPNLRKCAAAPFAGYCSTDILVLRPREGVDAGYAACVLQSEAVFDAAVQSAVGTKMPRTNWDALASTSVFAPEDNNEQRKIARVLKVIDNAINQTEALLAKQQRIKTGLMHDLLTRGLDAQGRLRDPSTHRFKKSPFGMIPEDWRPSKAGAECDQICVGIVIRPSQYYSETGVVALRSMNVQPGFFDLSEVVRISHEANASLSKSRLKAGDVVSVRTGEPGTTAVVTTDLEGCNCIDLVISRPSKSLRPQFLAIWMNSAFAVEHVFQNQGGLAQQHFNVGEMKQMPLPIPHVDEQDKIIEHVASAKRTSTDLEATLTKLRRLKTGLMHDLLTGERSVIPLLTTSRS